MHAARTQHTHTHTHLTTHIYTHLKSLQADADADLALALHLQQQEEQEVAEAQRRQQQHQRLQQQQQQQQQQEQQQVQAVYVYVCGVCMCLCVCVCVYVACLCVWDLCAREQTWIWCSPWQLQFSILSTSDAVNKPGSGVCDGWSCILETMDNQAVSAAQLPNAQLPQRAAQLPYAQEHHLNLYHFLAQPVYYFASFFVLLPHAYSPLLRSHCCHTSFPAWRKSQRGT